MEKKNKKKNASSTASFRKGSDVGCPLNPTPIPTLKKQNNNNNKKQIPGRQMQSQEFTGVSYLQERLKKKKKEKEKKIIASDAVEHRKILRQFCPFSCYRYHEFLPLSPRFSFRLFLAAFSLFPFFPCFAWEIASKNTRQKTGCGECWGETSREKWVVLNRIKMSPISVKQKSLCQNEVIENRNPFWNRRPRRCELRESKLQINDDP